MSIEDNLQEPLLERLSASPEPEDPTKTQSSAKKRKRGPEQDQSSRKTAKKSKTKKANAVDEDELDTELGINTAFSHMDNQLLADYVAQRTRKYESDLSLVELEDKYISGIHTLPICEVRFKITFLSSYCDSRHYLV
jgi:protein CMS1